MADLPDEELNKIAIRYFQKWNAKLDELSERLDMSAAGQTEYARAERRCVQASLKVVEAELRALRNQLARMDARVKALEA